MAWVTPVRPSQAWLGTDDVHSIDTTLPGAAHDAVHDEQVSAHLTQDLSHVLQQHQASQANLIAQWIAREEARVVEGYRQLEELLGAGTSSSAASTSVPGSSAADLERPTMLTDIWETPEVLRRLLQIYMKDGVVELPGLKDKLPPGHGLAGKTPLEVMAACSEKRMAEGFTTRFSLIGSGTSWHATLLAEYLIEYMARIPAESHYASEYRYQEPTLQPGDVVIIVSMSGETADAVESYRHITNSALGNSVLKIAVVNDSLSTLAKECDLVINVQAGTEVKRLHELPDGVQEVLDREAKPLMQTSRPISMGECPLWDIGCQNVLAQNLGQTSKNFIFLGRGCNFPVALEGAMKCKELAYIHAEGYPAAEMKHGPIALIDEFMPVVVVCPIADATYEKIKSNIEEVKARNGATIAITEKHNNELQQLCEYVIGLPETHEYLMPILAMIPLQLLAYMMGVLRNNKVDHPRGLVKSISVKIEETGAKEPEFTALDMEQKPPIKQGNPASNHFETSNEDIGLEDWSRRHEQLRKEVPWHEKATSSAPAATRSALGSAEAFLRMQSLLQRRPQGPGRSV
eukprot:Skav202216  [mRNA]  locus=scaffold1756:35844:43155:+ [translate_table: standard]